MTVAVMMMTSCYNYDEDITKSGDPVRVELAYTFSSVAGTQTRQADAVVKNDQIYPRLPQPMRIIPLLNTNAPQAPEISWDDTELKGDPRFALYRSRYCNLVTGVTGFLVYGNVENLPAPTGVNYKMYNGSLKETFPASILSLNDILDGISFNLEPIYKSSDYSSTEGIPEEASTLADYLTAIANTTVDSKKWCDVTDENLQNLYKKFTNFGYSLPGSAASVVQWINAVKSSASTFTVTENETEERIRQAIANATEPTWDETTANTVGVYPRNKNLPDGAAVLRWADVEENNEIIKKFVPQLNTTTLDNINSVARFAYPASLYYYISSGLKASDKKVDFKTIYNGVTTTTEKTAWEQVLEREEFDNASSMVTYNTRSVIMTSPVQYAVAQLKVKIKAASGTLPDASTPVKSISVGTNKFPLKGIIVCDQRPVDYNFDPITNEQGSLADNDELFIYDNQVKQDCYLTTTSAADTWMEACNTLVLQSQANEDVNIILEFENSSGDSFTCIDGIVYPGTRFYLIGKVEASRYDTGSGSVDNTYKNQVFTKDYITTVNMTVSSLAKAYNVPPNLLSNNLVIGVETTPQWIAATPTVIRLE